MCEGTGTENIKMRLYIYRKTSNLDYHTDMCKHEVTRMLKIMKYWNQPTCQQ